MQYYVMILCVHVRLLAPLNSYTLRENIVTQCKEKMYMLLNDSQLCNRGATKYIILCHNKRYMIHYLARSAKLPEWLYILPMFFLYFFIFFSGRLWSHAGSEANGPIFTKISGLVYN